MLIFAVFTSCDTYDPHSDLEGQGVIQMKINSDVSSAKIQSSFTQQGAIRVNDGINEIEIREVKFFIEEFELEGTSGTADYALED